MKSKYEQAKEILKGSVTSKDAYSHNAELEKVNIGIFCDIPHGNKYPMVRIYSLRLGHFHRYLGNMILWNSKGEEK